MQTSYRQKYNPKKPGSKVGYVRSILQRNEKKILRKVSSGRKRLSLKASLSYFKMQQRHEQQRHRESLRRKVRRKRLAELLTSFHTFA